MGVVAGSPRPTAALALRPLPHGPRPRPAGVPEALPRSRCADADVWEDRPQLMLMSGAMLKPAIDDLVKRFQAARRGGDQHDLRRLRHPRGADEGHEEQAEPDRHAVPRRLFRLRRLVHEPGPAVVRGRANRSPATTWCWPWPRGIPRQVKSIAGPDPARAARRPGASAVNSALGALTDDLLKKLGLHEKVYAAKRSQPDRAHRRRPHAGQPVARRGPGRGGRLSQQRPQRPGEADQVRGRSSR